MTTISRKIRHVSFGSRSGVINGFPYSTTLSDSGEYPFGDTRLGQKNPKWKSLVQNHQNAASPYVRESVREVDRVPSSSVVKYRLNSNNYYTETWGGTFVPFWSPDIRVYLVQDPNTSNQALIRFVKKCKESTRTYRGFVGLGEFVETIRAIRHPLMSLRKGFEDYGRAVVRNSKEQVRGVRTIGARRKAVTNAVSGTYLEYANGWRPLISDVQDLANTVARAMELKTDYYQDVKASAQSEALIGYTDRTFPRASGGLLFYTLHRGKRTHSCRIVGQVRIGVSGDSNWLKRSFGLTIGDFVPAIWELLPMSYVVNTFVDITGALETFGFDASSLAWVSRSNRLRADVTWEGVDPQADGGSLFSMVSGKPGSVSLQATRLTRDVPTSFIAWPALRLPTVGTWSKLANFTSLYAQLQNSSRSLWTMVH